MSGAVWPCRPRRRARRAVRASVPLLVRDGTLRDCLARASSAGSSRSGARSRCSPGCSRDRAPACGCGSRRPPNAARPVVAAQGFDQIRRDRIRAMRFREKALPQRHDVLLAQAQGRRGERYADETGVEVVAKLVLGDKRADRLLRGRDYACVVARWRARPRGMISRSRARAKASAGSRAACRRSRTDALGRAPSPDAACLGVQGETGPGIW